jgi:hypothetical protein
VGVVTVRQPLFGAPWRGLALGFLLGLVFAAIARPAPHLAPCETILPLPNRGDR